ncbi:PIN domain-containing protein [Polaromonas sp. P1-6]|nr:PIN domain-containing protein [Polaromonas sp. P1-6]
MTVRALHNEPKVADSLSWLDADNADDRIIASVLHIQATSPSAHVILVTGDINLQNKADAAMIETAEIDIDRPE